MIIRCAFGQVPELCAGLVKQVLRLPARSHLMVYG